MIRLLAAMANCFFSLKQAHDLRAFKKKEMILLGANFIGIFAFVILFKYVSTLYAFLWLIFLLILIPFLMYQDKHLKKKVISGVKHIAILFVLFAITAFSIHFGIKVLCFLLLFPCLYFALLITGFLSQWKKDAILYFIVFTPMVYGLLIYLGVNFWIVWLYFMASLIYPFILFEILRRKALKERCEKRLGKSKT